MDVATVFNIRPSTQKDSCDCVTHCDRSIVYTERKVSVSLPLGALTLLVGIWPVKNPASAIPNI